MNFRPITAAAILVVSALAGHAQGWTKNLYTSVGAAYVQQQDTILSESIGTMTVPGGTSTFDSGIRGDFILGYNINKAWGVEFNTGIIWNSMDTFNGTSLSSVNQTFNTYTIPFLANLVYRIPLKGPFSAYVGAGAGGAASILHYTSSTYDPSDSTFVFAYQAKAGVEYALTKHASLGVAYQFFGTTDPNWRFTVNYVGSILPPTDISFKEEGFYTHAFTVNFTWTF